MSRDTIKQQYYARAREGVFRTNEGLDTVARSPSLDSNFIKKTLHPFCVYKPPLELTERGEHDLSQYPESLTVFHADTGELVIGRSIYAGADFTGQRNTIFVHNYVIPRSRKEELLLSGNGIFRIEQFQSHYEEGSGKVLPELDELPASQESYLFQQQAILDRLNVDEKLFKQLLWAIMASVSSNKKVYIALDVDVTESSRYAKRLTEILFHCLPYAVRRHFGFSTFQNEPQGKKFINVMFVEKGSIRPGDKNMDKDFLFDFPNQRFVNTELPGNEQYYLDYAWVNKDRPDALKAFFAFAEEALQGLDEAKKLAVQTHYELCVLFQVDGGNSAFYSGNKEGVLNVILNYLDPATAAQKPKLYQLFYQLIDNEVHAGKTVSLEYLKAMMIYCRLADEGIRKGVLSSLAQFLFRTADDVAYTNEALRIIQLQQPDLFKTLIQNMQHIERLYGIFKNYVQSRVAAIASLKGIKDEIGFWLDILSNILLRPDFQDPFFSKVSQVLAKEGSIVEGGKQLQGFVKPQYAKHAEQQSFWEQMDLVIARTVLRALDLGRISVAEFFSLAYLTVQPSEAVRNSLDMNEKEKLDALTLVNYILGDQTVNEMTVYSALDEMSSARFDATQNMLKRFLKDRLHEYGKIRFAFYTKESTRYNISNNVELKYAEMLNYIYNSGKDHVEVYDFMLWTAIHSTTLDDNYKSAIRGFFKNQGKGALKNGKRGKMLLGSKNKPFNKLIRDIKLEQANPLIRFMVNRQKVLIVSFLSLLIALLAAWGTLKLWHLVIGKPAISVTDGNGHSPIPSKVPVESSKSTPSSPPAASLRHRIKGENE